MSGSTKTELAHKTPKEKAVRNIGQFSYLFVEAAKATNEGVKLEQNICASKLPPPKAVVIYCLQNAVSAFMPDSVVPFIVDSPDFSDVQQIDYNQFRLHHRSTFSRNDS